MDAGTRDAAPTTGAASATRATTPAGPAAVLTDAAKALALEVRPLPTVAAMTAAVTGMAMGGSVAGWPAYALLVATVLFASHLKDAWVDWYVRGEDQRFPWGRWPQTGELLSERGLFAAMAATLALFAGLLVLHWLRGAPPAFFAVALVGAALALSYAPVLDRLPLGSAASYPLGVGLAVVAGGLLSAGRLVPETLLYAAPLVVALAGAKVVEDLIDAGHDAELGKRTVPVALGKARAKDAGYAAVALGLLPLALLHPVVGVAVLTALGIAVASARLDVDRGIYPLVAGIYVVMATVLVLAWTGVL